MIYEISVADIRLSFQLHPLLYIDWMLSTKQIFSIVSLANMYDNPSYLLTCIQFGILKNVQCLLSRQVADKSYAYTIGLKLIKIAWGDASVLNCKYLLEMLGYYPSIPNIPSYARVSKSVRMSEMSVDLKYARWGRINMSR